MFDFFFFIKYNFKLYEKIWMVIKDLLELKR
jgi:hypothetical protein